MTPHYSDPWLTVYHGDARAVMAEMAPESVHCVVTSPPYWGLRDYGTATWIGGNEACDHRPPDEAGMTTKPTAGQRAHAGRFAGPTCYRCGATRQDGQLGLEPTPEAYVESMVAVFREVRRVLRSDGTVWLNLGDSYAGGGQTQPQMNDELPPSLIDGPRAGMHGRLYTKARAGNMRVPGLKPKDLVGIPWRVAFALQADGWYLRSGGPS